MLLLSREWTKQSMCRICAHSVLQCFEATLLWLIFNGQLNQMLKKNEHSEGSAYGLQQVSQHRAIQHRCFCNCDDSARFDCVNSAVGIHHSLWLRHSSIWHGVMGGRSSSRRLLNVCQNTPARISLSPSSAALLSLSIYTSRKWVKNSVYWRTTNINMRDVIYASITQCIPYQ